MTTDWIEYIELISVNSNCKNNIKETGETEIMLNIWKYQE